MTLRTAGPLFLGKRRGFTLMELLVVMLIMFIIMGMALVAWNGIVRGAALRGAVSNLHRLCSLARQHAMTHRTRVYVLFRQTGGTNASYLVCAQVGQHYGASGSDNLVAGFSRWNDNELNGGTVWNLSAESWARITHNGTNIIEGVLQGGTRQKWNAEDRFGWAVHDAEYLPPTLRFDNTENPPDNLPETIVFLPDGTTAKAADGDYTIKVKEIISKGQEQVTVKGMTGMVEMTQ